ncbi:MAG TPA: SDR family NAD(P)-dependent oxidoreductase [Candidatus Scybalocola faecipullorum]|nr:SDR family NAD(P)-dependent oxidoreductase [Candidatus Scybalocola faecipullorum]
MKTWLITGCSGGLGRGIAQAALERGENVAVTARDTEKIKDLAAQYPDHAKILYLDLNDRKSMRRAVSDTIETFGRLDVLVNNAGHGYRAAVEESEREKIEELFETNFFAPAELIKMVLPIMRSQKSGLIVNVTSVGAVRGALGNGYYSAAKGALELLTEALAKETKHLGIRTMIVEPGAFRTNFYGEHLLGTSRQIADYDVLADKYRKEHLNDQHHQPGDPVKGGKVIVETILSGNMPFRLILGSDALQAAEQVLEDRLKEAKAWESVSRTTDYR